MSTDLHLHSFQHSGREQYQPQPEIFETPDPPPLACTTTADVEDDPTSLSHATVDDVVRPRLCSVKQATNKFNQSGVDTSYTDFTTLLKESNRMYQTYNRPEYEQLVKDMQRYQKESLQQKYARLQRELNELEMECKHPQAQEKTEDDGSHGHKKYSDVEIKDPPTSHSILDGLLQLQTKLQSLDTHFQYKATNPLSSFQPLKQHLEALQQALPALPTSSVATPRSPSLTYEIHYASAPSSPALADLEQRLSRLEKVLGGPSLASPCIPLVPYLAQLESKVNTLSRPPPPPLPSSALPDPIVPSDTLETCYSLLKQLEPMLPVVPMILDRLLSLQMLHMEASETLLHLQHWIQLISTLENESHCLQHQFQTLTESIQNNKHQMEQNTMVILEKIQDLERRGGKTL